MLLCPDLNFLKWRFTRKHNRVRRLFGGEQEIDTGRIKVMKAGLIEQLELQTGGLLKPEGLGDFAKRFRNQLQLTDPRSCVVVEPKADLDRLYARLVEAVPAEAREEERSVLTEQQLHLAFTARLRERQLYDRLEHDVKVPARYKPHDYEFAHAYRNGNFRIIDEVSFGWADPDRNCDRALALASEIEDVTTHKPRGETEFKLVVSFAPDQQEAEAAIRRLFADRRVALWVPEQLDSLVDAIGKELHD